MSGAAHAQVFTVSGPRAQGSERTARLCPATTTIPLHISDHSHPWHLWVSDMSAVNWSTQATERPIPSILPRALELLAQGYWTLLVLLMTPTLLVAMARPKSASRLSVLVLSVLMYWSLFHFMGFGGGRFHLPVIPIIAIASSVQMYDIAGRLRERIRSDHASDELNPEPSIVP